MNLLKKDEMGYYIVNVCPYFILFSGFFIYLDRNSFRKISRIYLNNKKKQAFLW